MLGVLARERRVLRDEIGAVAVFERRIRAEHPDRAAARCSAASRASSTASVQSAAARSPRPAARERAALRAERVRRERLRARRGVVPMDLADQLRSLDQRGGRPQRQRGRGRPAARAPCRWPHRGAAAWSARAARRGSRGPASCSGYTPALMPTPRAVASHTVAGRVEATRLAVRAREETVAPAAADAPLREASAPWGAGGKRLAGVELRVEVDAGAGGRVVRRGREQPGTASGLPGRRRAGLSSGSAPARAALRFLRHGWQSWSDDRRARSRRRRRAGLSVGSVAARHAPRAWRAGERARGLARIAPGAGRRRRHRWDPRVWSACSSAAARSACSTRAATDDDVLIEAELAVEARLEPGEVRRLERVRVALGLDASALLEAFARCARPARCGAHRASVPRRLVQLVPLLPRRERERRAAQPRGARGGAPAAVRRRHPDRRRLSARDRRLARDQREVPARPRAARRGDPRGGLHGGPLDRALLRRRGEPAVRRARRLAAAQRRRPAARAAAPGVEPRRLRLRARSEPARGARTPGVRLSRAAGAGIRLPEARFPLHGRDASRRLRAGARARAASARRARRRARGSRRRRLPARLWLSARRGGGRRRRHAHRARRRAALARGAGRSASPASRRRCPPRARPCAACSRARGCTGVCG